MSSRRKHLVSMLDVQPPIEGQQIARALGSRGSNLVEVNGSATCTQSEGLVKLGLPALHTEGVDLHAAKQTAGVVLLGRMLLYLLALSFPLHGPSSAATSVAGDALPTSCCTLSSSHFWALLAPELTDRAETKPKSVPADGLLSLPHLLVCHQQVELARLSLPAQKDCLHMQLHSSMHFTVKATCCISANNMLHHCRETPLSAVRGQLAVPDTAISSPPCKHRACRRGPAAEPASTLQQALDGKQLNYILLSIFGRHCAGGDCRSAPVAVPAAGALPQKTLDSARQLCHHQGGRRRGGGGQGDGDHRGHSAGAVTLRCLVW